jgi:hypothetical protein
MGLLVALLLPAIDSGAQPVTQVAATTNLANWVTALITTQPTGQNK